ncbi:hypothetical protein D9601_07875 [Sphingomonas sp. MA1305]|nr:hypothetical protein [Sphingomonas sp. MA1305]
MEGGVGDYAEMKARLAAALAERAEIDREAEEGAVVLEAAMHPNLAEAYRRNVDRLTEVLTETDMEAGDARQAIRNLIELITAEPRREGRGLDLIVHGRLAQILHVANGRPDISRAVPREGSTRRRPTSPTIRPRAGTNVCSGWLRGRATAQNNKRRPKAPIVCLEWLRGQYLTDTDKGFRLRFKV